MNLPAPRSNADSLRNFSDRIECNIRGLESLGTSESTFGAILTPIIYNKLLSDVRKIITRDRGNDNWDIKSLRVSIKREVCVQVAGQSIGASHEDSEILPTASQFQLLRYKRMQSSSHLEFLSSTSWIPTAGDNITSKLTILDNESNVSSTANSLTFLSSDVHDFYLRMINDKIYKKTLLPSLIYLSILLIIGLPGNLLVSYIYHTKERNITGNTKSREKKSSDIFIITLAWLDILNCILSVPMEIYLLRYFVQFDHPWICKLSRYVAMVLNAASSFVLLGIAVDRFIGIKYSQSKHRFTATTAIKFVIASIFLATFISTPGIILYGTQTVPLPRGIHGKTCLIEDHFAHTKYPFILSMFLTSLHLLFDTFFIILYSIVGKKVIGNRNLSSMRLHTGKRQTRFKSKNVIEISHITFNNCYFTSFDALDKNKNVQLNGFKQNEKCGTFTDDPPFTKQSNITTKKSKMPKDSAVHGKVYKAGKTTFMLFVVTIVFMLTFAPYCAIAILRNVSPENFYSKLSNIEKAFYQLFLRSYLLSSAANPVIYSFLSDRFRQQCLFLLKRVFHRQ
ncbi:CCKAR [Mytilus coruscus]|uniref:CCKAR n=1 Tax=Mytilus coruscus TaxID=42192 RepID=A0A6J8E2P7_MYTCO|nr:CCKAR [Mytilus coruscus]